MKIEFCNNYSIQFLRNTSASTESRESCCRRASRIRPISEKTCSDAAELAGTQSKARARPESLEKITKNIFTRSYEKISNRSIIKNISIEKFTWERLQIDPSTISESIHHR